MTPEASLTKLSYLLSRSELSLEEKRKLMEENLRGEKTVINEQSDPQSLLNDTNLLRSLTKLLTSNTVGCFDCGSFVSCSVSLFFLFFRM